MATLYRGSRSNVNALVPQPIPEGDKHRFPPEVDRVVFATDDKTDAEIYAVCSQRDMSGFLAGKDRDGKWHVKLPISAREFARMQTHHVFIYEINDEMGEFKRPLEGDEWYAETIVYPERKERVLVRDIVNEWQREGKVELYFHETEKERLKG